MSQECSHKWELIGFRKDEVYEECTIYRCVLCQKECQYIKPKVEHPSNVMAAHKVSSRKASRFDPELMECVEDAWDIITNLLSNEDTGSPTIASVLYDARKFVDAYQLIREEIDDDDEVSDEEDD